MMTNILTNGRTFPKRSNMLSRLEPSLLDTIATAYTSKIESIEGQPRIFVTKENVIKQTAKKRKNK